MKLKNILYAGLAVISLTACNDYLEVDAPSAYGNDLIYTQKSEITRALTGVYAQILSNNLYGDAYQRTFVLNSDVDMQISSTKTHAHDSYARLDCDAQGSAINSYWTAAYNAIEYANRFIDGVENGPLAGDKEVQQMVGEAKCLRAMIYHDLVVMFGDVPFNFTTATKLGNNLVIPIVDRQIIQDSLIADLKTVIPNMQDAKAVTVERCSKEFAQALVARIALTAGGYSLRPDKTDPRSYGEMKRPDNYKEYYQIARDYALQVINSNTHSLKKTYQQEFVDECNYIVTNDDDPIFEIPFAKNASGNVGYRQGPTYSSYEGKTVGPWGETSGNARLNAFYRFLFKDEDQRREYVNGLWYYSYVDHEGAMIDTVYIRSDYTVHNNKWSKLWTDKSSALGDVSTGSTGINFPYMRYVDVLLMFAEADNEIAGQPTDDAKKYLEMVHKRGFPAGDNAFMTEASASKEAFLKAVLNERAWEFAGENMRWRDLVRNNMYAEELIYSFLRYHTAAVRSTSLESGFEDAIDAHDKMMNGTAAYIKNLPVTIRYHVYDPSEYNNLSKAFSRGASNKKQMYGCIISGYDDANAKPIYDRQLPNTSMMALRIYNAYKKDDAILSASKTITAYGFKAENWESQKFYNWGNDDGSVKDQCKYSFFGYVRSDESNNLYVVENGMIKELTMDYLDGTKELPVVRYILPYPNVCIQRSNGAYKNYYGY